MKQERLFVVAMMLALSFSACDLGGPDYDDTLNFDAAVVAADGTIEDLEMMHGPKLGMRGIVFPGLLGNMPNCPKTEDVFLCDPIVRDGMTYTRAIVYRDAAGNAQDAYDENTTASIEYEIAVQGERGRMDWGASINRTRRLVVTGLQDGSGTVTWNGSGSEKILRSRHTHDGEERSYDINATNSTVDVIIPYPREDDSWPLSGTVERSMTIVITSDGSDSTVERDVSVEFNGTSEVSVTVDGETYTIDLSERRFGPRHLRGGRHK